MSSPFNNRTPESYFAGLRRKDSKNALTTCHGVTDKGRACRRALASPKNSSRYDGAVVLTNNVEDPAVFFCWQHKDQADTLIGEEERSVVSLKGRHSLEDAFRSLGLDDVDEEPEPSSKEPSPAPPTPPHVNIPEPTRTVANDLSTKPSPYSYEPSRHRRTNHEERRHHEEPRTRPTRRRSERPSAAPASRSSFGLFSCCFGSSSRDQTRASRSEKVQQDLRPKPIVRDGHRTSGQRPVAKISISDTSSLPSSESPRTPNELRRKQVPSHRKTDSGFAMASREDYRRIRRDDNDKSTNRLDVVSPSNRKFDVYRDQSPTPAPRQAYQQGGDPKSDSMLAVPADRPVKLRSKSTPDAQRPQRLHGEWPPPLPRNATDITCLTYAKLLTAMSEPPSKTDCPGYIYLFWQTDVEQTEDETSAVATIISAPTMDRGLQRQETILQRRFFQTSANATMPETEKRTIFLKIGRAVNVHQRLHQWKKQCEYDISLLRSYPYDSKRRGLAAQVPNVVKVERLIHLHLEMLGQRVSKQCRCGTEHKEWFEVGATGPAVREVDEIVRRWVRWSEDRFT